MTKSKLSVGLFVMLIIASAQQKTIGIFVELVNIVKNLKLGQGIYLLESKQYVITGTLYNNWFAHISPDGKWMVFLTFLPTEVEPGIHPPYKHVYIRLLPITGGTPKVLAYFYSGQGSMNTPSWSPDSKHIAFISNTKLIETVN